MQQPVGIELRTDRMLVGADRERAAAGVDLSLGRVGNDPILEAVDRHGRLRIVGHDEEPGNRLLA